MNKKYKLTNNTENYFGTTLYQIEAIADFGSVSKGDLGGYIEKEANLEQSGNAWVSGDARVYGDAWVYGDARVYGDAWVSGDAWVYGNALVFGNLKLSLGYFEEESSQKTELLKKADELIAKANELKRQAESL